MPSPKLFAVLLALTFFAPGTLIADPVYTRVTSGEPAAPVLLHMSHGVGTGNILFAIAAGKKAPAKIEASDAIGALSTVPAADIHISGLISDGKSFSVSVSVRTSVYLEHGKPYDSAVVIYPDGGDSPTKVTVRLEDDSMVSVEVSPTSIATSLNDSGSLTQILHVRNTGQTTIQGFHVAGSNFADAGNIHRLIMNAYDSAASLSPGQSEDLTFPLPQPALAGTYSGSVTVTPDANSLAEKTIPVTLQARGPYGGGWQGSIPFLLLVCVVLVGFACSSMLDVWFGSGGLQKAQALLSLQDAGQRFSEIEKQIADWNHSIAALAPPNQIVKMDLWMQANLKALQRLLDNWASRTADNLNASALAYSIQSDAAEIFADHVSLAILHYSGNSATLQKVIGQLDAKVPPTTSAGLVDYAAALTGVVIPASAPAFALTAAVVVSGALSAETPMLAKIKEKIRAMDWLRNVVVWMVVLITAYLSFYATHYAFGSLADYMTVFLWSLGLTTTGTQIVAGVRKP